MITTGAHNTTHECFRVAFWDILVAHRIFGTQIWLYIAVVCQMRMYMQVLAPGEHGISQACLVHVCISVLMQVCACMWTCDCVPVHRVDTETNATSPCRAARKIEQYSSLVWFGCAPMASCVPATRIVVGYDPLLTLCTRHLWPLSILLSCSIWECFIQSTDKISKCTLKWQIHIT